MNFVVLSSILASQAWRLNEPNPFPNLAVLLGRAASARRPPAMLHDLGNMIPPPRGIESRELEKRNSMNSFRDSSARNTPDTETGTYIYESTWLSGLPLTKRGIG